MKNTENENLAMHSHQVAVIAHALAVIGNTYFNKHFDAEHIAVMALFHDACEVMTGDMPTPVKYNNDEIKNAYKKLEKLSGDTLIAMLPEEFQPIYRSLINDENGENQRILKQADKISAYLKCVDERKAGNMEFKKAEKTIFNEINADNGDEIQYFIKNILPVYEKSLDEL